ncbi:MAG: CgeB family protein [Leptospirillum sp.]|jgi:spore maturation protein CgeB
MSDKESESIHCEHPERFSDNLRMIGPGALTNRLLSRDADKFSADSFPPVLAWAKNGQPVMSAGGISLHSVYDPEKEGDLWVREALSDGNCPEEGVLILGLGMGHHVMSFLNRTSCPVWVFEPDLRRLRISLSYMEWFRFRGRIRFLTERSDLSSISPGVRLLVHSPSERTHPNGYVAARKMVGSIHGESIASLRILVIPPVYGGSYPVAQGVANGLKAAGHRVSFFEAAPFEGALRAIGAQTSLDLHKRQLHGLFSGFMDEMVMARVLSVKPDLIVALAQAPLSLSLLKRLREMGYPVAYWFVEDFRLTTYWESVAPLVHDFAVIQKEPFLSKLSGLGVRGRYLPAAADPNVFFPRDLSAADRSLYGAPVGFMGAGYHNRQRFFPKIADLGLKIFGTEWNPADPLVRNMPLPNRRMSPDECARIFSATDVNINLHSSVYHNGVNPDGDFVNPRTFEIAACGAFSLVDRRSLMEELFVMEGPLAEVALFDDENSLRAAVTHYLKHPEERRAISQRAMARVLRDHSYEVRMSQWIGALIEEGLRPANPEMSGRWPVDRLISRAAGDDGLVSFLNRYRHMGSVGLDDIVGQIAPGKDQITPEEATFLLMKEFSGGPG